MCRLFHKGEVGGQLVRVRLCPKVRHPWVVGKRPPTFDAVAVDATHITSRKASVLLVDMEQPLECALTAGQRKLTDPEFYYFQ